MFPTLTLTRSRASTSSSTSSNSPPPTTISPFFATSLKSSLSPPTTTTTTSPTDYFSFSPSSGFFSPSSPGNLTTAYPSWPQRASLSLVLSPRSNPNVSIHSPTRAASPGFHYNDAYTCPTSYISDEDLLDLAGWGLSCADENAPDADAEGLGISWSATRQPEVVVGEERRRRNARVGPAARLGGRRERSRSVKKAKGGLGPIAE
ncbi:hypothetical protein MMC11_003946 [Xylographa trunciseda]|nr:hypothetical protein [Xylographa trunciseda]